jgi:hypothetical protein
VLPGTRKTTGGYGTRQNSRQNSRQNTVITGVHARAQQGAGNCPSNLRQRQILCTAVCLVHSRQPVCVAHDMPVCLAHDKSVSICRLHIRRCCDCEYQQLSVNVFFCLCLNTRRCSSGSEHCSHWRTRARTGRSHLNNVVYSIFLNQEQRRVFNLIESRRCSSGNQHREIERKPQLKGTPSTADLRARGSLAGAHALLIDPHTQH